MPSRRRLRILKYRARVQMLGVVAAAGDRVAPGDGVAADDQVVQIVNVAANEEVDYEAEIAAGDEVEVDDAEGDEVDDADDAGVDDDGDPRVGAPRLPKHPSARRRTAPNRLVLPCLTSRSPVNGKLKCAECDGYFTPAALPKHCDTHRNLTGSRYSCEYCANLFVSQALLDAHKAAVA